MFEKNTARCLSLLLCFCMVFSILPFSAFATEAETFTEEHSTETASEVLYENPVVQEFQTQMNDMLTYYLGSANVAPKDVPALAALLDEYALSDAAFEILVMAEDMTYAMEDGLMNEEEAKSLVDNNPAAVAFSDYAMDYAELPNINLYKNGNFTPINGIAVNVSSANDTSESSGTVTVTAKGSGGFFGISAKTQTATITITNNTGNNGTLSFDWTASSVHELIIDGEKNGNSSGSFSKALSTGASVTITVTTDKNSTINKLVMRNFAFVESLAAAQITVNYNGSLGGVTANGDPVTANTVYPFAAEGDKKDVTFVAVPNSGTGFIAWVESATNKILSTKSTYIVEPTTSELAIKAVFGTNAHFQVNGYLYENWASAINAANGNGTVILMNSATLPTGDYKIPQGVTLLIPFDDAHTLITANMENHLHTVDTTFPEKVEYRRLTMADGAKITVNEGGAISISSRAHIQMVGQTGPYGSIVMDKGSSITIENGANLYAWGYIFPGSNGAGTVTIKSGGAAYENMMVMDYTNSAGAALNIYGGQGSEAWNAFANLNGGKAFPLRTYSLRNVEVPMTLNYGATSYGYYNLYGSNAGTHSGYIAFIGDSAGDVFQLSASDSNIVKSYVSGKAVMEVNGDASLNPLKVDIKTSLASGTMDTSKSSGIPLGAEYSVRINRGVSTLSDSVIFCEGSFLEVGENATMQARKNIYVLDSAEDYGAINPELTGETNCYDIHGVNYVYSDTDAVLDINGKLIADGGFYTTASKAAITSSKGTGIIEFNGANDKTSIPLKYDRGGVYDVGVYSAYLKNGDGNHTTFQVRTGTRYVYSKEHNKWAPDNHTSNAGVVTPPTCEDKGYTIYTCACGYSYKSNEVAALGHSYNAVVTAPTCTAGGYTTYTCSNCGDSYQDNPTEKVEHAWDDGVVTQEPTPETEGVKTITCSACGATKTEKVPVKKLKISYASMTMANSLDMNFAFEKNQVEDWSGYSVQITKIGESTATQTIAFEKWASTTINGIEHYYVTFTGIAAKEMTDQIEVQILKNGNVVSEIWKDSVREQAMRNLANTDKQMTKTMVVDMLNYGAAAQVKLGYRTSDLANSKLTETQKGFATKEAKFENTCTQNSQNGYYANVVLGTSLQSVMAFSKETGIENAQTAEIEFTNHYGTSKNFTMNVSDLKKDANGYWIINITETVIADGRRPITCTFKNGDSIIYSVTDSIESYVARAVSLDTTGSNICSMLMKFSDSAYAYLHAKALGTLQ